MPIKKQHLVERFWEKVEIGGEDDCWLWKGSLISTGYGEMVIHHRVDRGRQKVSAHRLSLMFHGIDCEGLVVHHRCQQILCVNPAHLELMERGEHSSHHHTVQWNKEKVIEAIQRFVSEHGVYPAAGDWNPGLARRHGHLDRVRRYNEGTFPCSHTVQRLFGSWNNGLRAAGCEHAGIGRRRKEYSIPRDAV